MGLNLDVPCDRYTQVRQGVTTASYHPCMTLVFSGERGQDGRMKPVPGTYLNQRGEVQSVNPEANTVTVRLGKTEQKDPENEKDLASRSPFEHHARAPRNITKTFDAARLSGKTTLYRIE